MYYATYPSIEAYIVCGEWSNDVLRDSPANSFLGFVQLSSSKKDDHNRDKDQEDSSNCIV